MKGMGKTCSTFNLMNFIVPAFILILFTANFSSRQLYLVEKIKALLNQFSTPDEMTGEERRELHGYLYK